MKKKILFIINPISGTKSKSSFIAKIEAEFKNENFELVIEFSKGPNDAYVLAKEAVDKLFDCVVACGGDGTINEIGKALIHSNTSLGIVPFGSGNGLARHLKIPMQAAKALLVIKKFDSQIIDTGRINKTPFVGIAGIGFDAHIGKAFAKLEKRGFYSYLKLILREYLNYKKNKIELTLNRQTKTKKVLMVNIANSSQFGNNAVIAPMAELSDGWLELCTVKKFPLWRAPRIAWLMWRNKIHKSEYIRIERFKKMEITQQKKWVHLDGEPIKLGRKLKIKIVPHSLAVLVP